MVCRLSRRAQEGAAQAAQDEDEEREEQHEEDETEERSVLEHQELDGAFVAVFGGFLRGLVVFEFDGSVWVGAGGLLGVLAGDGVFFSAV